ncbi:adenosylcobinamide amidohydrolase [Kitasatospora sp. NPDC002965]|uniref:adenosylcobinamide amidohydrolase n=1 Tax=Kitasatospora sp. NPDC002965 TaxID=3154775 RepID=UPI0033BF45B2
MAIPQQQAGPPGVDDGVFGDPVVIERSGRPEDGECRHLLVWRAGPGWRMLSSAVLGGGLGEREWLVNAQVRAGYGRTDPDRHLAQLAEDLGLRGPGVGLMTAARVDAFTWARDHGVTAVVTTGIGVPTWASAPADGDAPGDALVPGTINIVVVVPVALSDAAAVNLVATVTEAKVQALLEAGYDCSGTPSDAVCVAVRRTGPGREAEPFGGPRSRWGSRAARAVHAAVVLGAERDRAGRVRGPVPGHLRSTPGCGRTFVLSDE